MKFEYKQFWLDIDNNSVRRVDQTLDSLQELGKDGWEVCFNLYKQGTTSILLLKRKIKL